MIPLELQIAIAFILDIFFGDPRKLPHPVKFIGWTAQALESPFRRAISNQRLAGTVVAAIVIISTGLITWGIIRLGTMIHPLVSDLFAISLLWTSIAARDLVNHSSLVHTALNKTDLDNARLCVGMLVGRDTDRLTESEIVRATVESVAENTVDGATAPLMYAVCFGPIGALAYKAINTLDSTFGYKNERYLKFGWASARIDDVANWLPARFTALVMIGMSFLLKMHACKALYTYIKDRRQHPSPNSGQVEAVMAGAMNVQLGGVNYYHGIPSVRPTMGQPGEILKKKHILKANRLMYATVTATLMFALVVRMTLARFIN